MFFWALVNFAISAGCFRLIKSPLVRAYLVINFILVIQPIFIVTFFGLAHPLYQPGNPIYSTVLIFQAVFNLIVCCSFVLFMRVLPRLRLLKRSVLMHPLNSSRQYSGILKRVLFLAIIGAFGKYSLVSLGAFKMNSAGASTSQFLQLLKSFSSFDLMAIAFLGEFRLNPIMGSKKINFFLIPLLIVSACFAVFSGSRSQVITILLFALMAYRDVIGKNKIVSILSIVIAMPSLFIMFPLLAHYRNFDFDFSEAFYQLEIAGRTGQAIMFDVISTRLNYNEAIARAFDFVQTFGPAGGDVYWSNIIGLIPRVIWPSKPLISNNSQLLGHYLGIVTSNDESTSIGLQVVGEAFYEFGWLGIWVAAFQGLIFTFIHKNFFYPHNRVAMTIFTVSSVYVLQRDGYFAVIPGLVWQAISYFVFFGFISISLYGFRLKPRY